MQVYLILALLFALGTATFAFQNQMRVSVNVFAWQAEGSLAIVILATLSIGVLIGILASLPTLIKRSWKIASQGRRIHELEKSSTASNDAKAPKKSETEKAATK